MADRENVSVPAGAAEAIAAAVTGAATDSYGCLVGIGVIFVALVGIAAVFVRGYNRSSSDPWLADTWWTQCPHCYRESTVAEKWASYHCRDCDQFYLAADVRNHKLDDMSALETVPEKSEQVPLVDDNPISFDWWPMGCPSCSIKLSLPQNIDPWKIFQCPECDVPFFLIKEWRGQAQWTPPGGPSPRFIAYRGIRLTELSLSSDQISEAYDDPAVLSRSEGIDVVPFSALLKKVDSKQAELEDLIREIKLLDAGLSRFSSPQERQQRVGEREIRLKRAQTILSHLREIKKEWDRENPPSGGK